MHAIEVRRNRRSRSPHLRRQAAAHTGSRPGADQGRGHRRQFHRHLLPVRPVPARGAVRRRHRGVRDHRRGRRRCGRPERRRPGGDGQGTRRVRRILARASRFRCLRARRGGLRRDRIGASEGDDGALPDQVGVPGPARGHGAGARRRGRSRADPDPVGHQHRHQGDHHRVDAGESRTVPAGGRRRGARLSGGSGRVRRQDPRPHRRPRGVRGLRRRRQDHLRRQPGQPRGPRHAGVVRGGQRTGSAGGPAAAQQPPGRCSSPARIWRITPAPPTSSAGGQAR